MGGQGLRDIGALAGQAPAGRGHGLIPPRVVLAAGPPPAQAHVTARV